MATFPARTALVLSLLAVLTYANAASRTVESQAGGFALMESVG
jgi:hypothetical protein